MTVSEILDHVTRLIESYPPRTVPISDGYLGALAAALASYPRAVIVKCCDPAQGVALKCHYLPAVADVNEFCERETAPLRRVAQRHDEARRQVEQAQRGADNAAELAVNRATRPTYDELKNRHGPDWGLASTTGDEADNTVHLAKIKQANETLYARACAAAGHDPAKGYSPALVRALKDREKNSAQGENT